MSSLPSGQCAAIAWFSTSFGVLKAFMQVAHSHRKGRWVSIFTGGGDGEGAGEPGASTGVAGRPLDCTAGAAAAGGAGPATAAWPAAPAGAAGPGCWTG